jgi:hypothetical protein
MTRRRDMNTANNNDDGAGLSTGKEQNGKEKKGDSESSYCYRSASTRSSLNYSYNCLSYGYNVNSTIEIDVIAKDKIFKRGANWDTFRNLRNNPYSM